MKTESQLSNHAVEPRQNRVNQWRTVITRYTLIYALAGGFALPQRAASQPAAATYRNDRILVKRKKGVLPAALANLHGRLGNRVLRSFPQMGNWEVLTLPGPASVSAQISAYEHSGLVDRAEPDYTVQVDLEPNDFHYYNGDMWHLKNVGQYGGTPGADIHAPAGWDIQHTASNIVVAAIDTGVRYTHEDLAPNMWVDPVDGSHGTNVVFGTNDPWDDYGHGTHISGTIGAVGNNSVGVVGVCWQVQIMACKCIDALGNCSISDAVTCIDFARRKGARIINASWGGTTFDSAALRDAINAARDAGIIFVTAAGNSASDNDAVSFSPADYIYDNIITVAATDRNDNLAIFSNYGATTVHLAAPGSPVYSCWNGSDSDYAYRDGTSMSVPQVVGACALVWAHYPALTHHQVIKRVLYGVDVLPSLAGKCVTGGRLNLAKVLGAQPAPTWTSNTVWVDDALPAGAVAAADGGDSWTWVTNNPPPYSGTQASQSNIGSGLHEHYFANAAATLEVFPGDTLYAYVYLDPANVPSEVMLQWNDGCWEHRAYWGADIITYGMDGTSDRLSMGPLPSPGEWVRLEVPAHAVGLEGATLKGMSFTLVDGRATWDYAGRFSPGPLP
jgi:subtilisin family serine protease